MQHDRRPSFISASAYGCWVVLTALAVALPWQAEAQSAGGPAWTELSPSEQHALEPLRGQWSAIDSERKAKWREVAGRYPSLSPDQQQRLRARMADWDGMSAAQRSEARNRFRESTQLPDAERKARWEAYQSLSREQREALAARAAANRAAPPSRLEPGEGGNRRLPGGDRVGPGSVQARPGATTRSLAQPPVPPRHQQPGLPKIAATPGFVDSTTLQPKRGPQGAAVQPRRRNRDSQR